jgi:hypothetical protein
VRSALSRSEAQVENAAAAEGRSSTTGGGYWVGALGVDIQGVAFLEQPPVAFHPSNFSVTKPELYYFSWPLSNS